jgi:hypothetical protein
MTTDQLTYDADELLADHPDLEPLIAGGRRCHGGFDDTGAYVSPRTLYRVPAIRAWQDHHRATFGTELLDLAVESFPGHYPNVAQAKLLLRHGVTEPIVSTLTRIGTVEGFGSFLRYSTVPDLQANFVEDIEGTAMAHLDRGLIEAHARDEAGFGDEAGHNLMWFAARDIAFEHPFTEDQTALMLERMGISGPGGAMPDLAAARVAAMAMRRFPDDIDFDLEALIDRLVRLLLIEIAAFHAFAWAEEVLGDAELCAGEGEAARIVSYIRTDETPHVEYIKTVLTEMRDRTFVGESGRRYPGTELIGMAWDAAVAEQRGARRHEVLELSWREVCRAVSASRHGDDLLEEFVGLGTVRRLDDGTWTDLTAEDAA